MSGQQPQTAVTAPKTIPLRIAQGDRGFNISPDAEKIMLTKTKSGQWTSEEIATIGESDLLVVRNEQGFLKGFKKTVRLFEAKKEIALVYPSWIVTVQGYIKLNQVAGLHEITPPSMIIAGKEESNPFIEYQNGEIKKVIVRKMVIGYSIIGNLVAIDVVRHYNFDAYFMQDIAAKAKKFPDAVRFGTLLACPFDSKGDAQVAEKSGHSYCKIGSKIYLFKQTKDIEGYWIDVADEQVRDIYNQHIQHQKFGDVIAQNVASRNAKKAHPAIAATNVIPMGPEKDHYADIVVFGYRSVLDKEEAEKIAERIRKGEQISNVEVSHSVEDTDYSDFTSERETVVNDEGPEIANAPSSMEVAPTGEVPPPSEPPTEKTATSGKGKNESITQKIERLAKEKGVDHEKIASDMFNGAYFSLDEKQLGKLLSTIEGIRGGKK